MTRLSRLRSWLQRHRHVALILSAAFLIFEATRAFSIGQYLLPEWSAQAGPYVERISAFPPWIMFVVMVLTVVFFVVPMAGVIYAGLRIRRAIVPLLNRR